MNQNIDNFSRKTLELYAACYLWIREQTWDKSDFVVVRNPKQSLMLGSYCPSGEYLDEIILEKLKLEKPEYIDTNLAGYVSRSKLLDEVLMSKMLVVLKADQTSNEEYLEVVTAAEARLGIKHDQTRLAL